MAIEIKFTIPDTAIAKRINEAFTNIYPKQPDIELTDAEWFKKCVIDWIKSCVRRYEERKAQEAMVPETTDGIIS